MCGIAGFIAPSDRSLGDEDAVVLDRMCRVMTHRGPDDQGMILRGRVALGMRRLAVIDLAGGRQPISNEDGSITIVFNGEIYNHRELRRELEQRGHRFRTVSDTEAIVHAYEEFGPACPERLRGMFAFALWDEREQTFFAARDRVGKKPFYYSLTPGGSLVFGSELKSLLEHPQVTREIDPEALDRYFSLGYVPDPHCIFRQAHKLAPGHSLTFARARMGLRQYWDFDFSPGEIRSEAECQEQLRALLDEAVRVRLVSDVPLGAFLSGGVDSTAVVGLMARAQRKPVKTFSIGFHEDSYNELDHARRVAELYQTEHHEFIVTPDVCHVVDELAWQFDEPFADPSAVPTYMLSRLAREHVTVVLSGDGGDELFAGYTRYVTERQRGGLARVPAFARRGMMQPLSRRLPHGAFGRNFLYNVSLDPVDRYADNVSAFGELNKPALYTGDFLRHLRGADRVAGQFRALAARSRSGDPLDALLYIDSKTYLPGDILTKVDRMSMAASLEARAPLLDHRLIDFVTRLPASMKMRGREGKHIFKQAMREIVPGEILERPKQGFGVPLQQWLNRELRDRIRETLTEPRTQQRGYVEPRYVNRLLEEHHRGRRDHSTALWTLLMLELWHRQFIDRPPATTGTRPIAVHRPPVAA